MVNGLYFVNCEDKTGNRRSGIAFYEDLGDNNHNTDEQPKSFAYTDVAGWIKWEQDIDQTVTFHDGVTVTWKIELDAQTKNQQDIVGTATNGFQSFTIRKDNNTHLFWNNDGYDCTRLYYAFAN